MANYSTLKAAVADVVKTNGTQAITGANLQTVLLSIINSVGGGGYIFKGVATPSTDAGTPDENVFYIGGAGTYANFGTSVTVPVGSICLFKYNGSWATEQIEIFNANVSNSVVNLPITFTMDLQGYLDATTGNFVSSVYYITSDFIAVQTGMSVSYNRLYGGAYVCVAAYDENKNYLAESSLIFDTSGYYNGTFQIADGVSYVRLCQHINSGYGNIAYTFVIGGKGLWSIALELKHEAKQLITANKIDKSPYIFEQTNITNLVTYVDGGYYSETATKEIGWTANNTISAVVVPVEAGKTYLISVNQLVAPDSTEAKSSYIFADDDIENSAIYINEIPNYAELFDGANTLYKITVPTGCTKFVSAVLTYKKNRVVAYEATVQEEIAWLQVSDSNFSIEIWDRINNIIYDTINSEQNLRDNIYHLWDSIKKPIEFTGKTLVAFGDSITKGVSSPNLVLIQDSYIKLFCDYAGVSQLINNAISGSCLADADGVSDSIYDKVIGYTGNADIIWIAGGTNDWNTGKPVGSFGSTDTHTTYGALKGICEHLKTNYPNAVVIFVTPIPYTKPVTSYPSHIAELNEYRTAIYDVATEYGYNVVDGNSLGMPRMLGGWNNIMCADSDGCHPTADGHALYARSLTGKLL